MEKEILIWEYVDVVLQISVFLSNDGLSFRIMSL